MRPREKEEYVNKRNVEVSIAKRKEEGVKLYRLAGVQKILIN